MLVPFEQAVDKGEAPVPRSSLRLASLAGTRCHWRVPGLAMQAEGKTEEQALPPDLPPANTEPSFTMPIQLGKVAGTEHREPVPAAPHVRRLAREIGVDIHDVKGSGPAGRISEDDVKLHAEESAHHRCLQRRPPATSSAGSAGLREMGQDRTRFHARRAPQDGRNISPKPGIRFPTSPSRTRPTSPSSSSCARVSLRRPKRPAAR